MSHKATFATAILFLVCGIPSMAQTAELSPAVREFGSVDAPVVALTGVRVIELSLVHYRDGKSVAIVDMRDSYFPSVRLRIRSTPPVRFEVSVYEPFSCSVGEPCRRSHFTLKDFIVVER